MSAGKAQQQRASSVGGSRAGDKDAVRLCREKMAKAQQEFNLANLNGKGFYEHVSNN